MKKKESTLKKHAEHPSTRLALIKLHDFIQEYHNCTHKYLINLSVGMLLSDITVSEESTFKESQSFDLELDVPYVQSQHYESNTQFQEDEPIKINQISQNTRRTEIYDDLEDENFTDQEEEESRMAQIKIESIKIGDNSKYNQGEFEEDINSQEFQFTSMAKKCVKDSSNLGSVVSYPFSSTNYQETEEKFMFIREEDQIQTMKQTAYFNLERDRDRVDRKIHFDVGQSKDHSKENNLSYRNQKLQDPNKQKVKEMCKLSMKELMLNKIQKEKTRKKIAESLIKDKNFVNKFLID